MIWYVCSEFTQWACLWTGQLESALGHWESALTVLVNGNGATKANDGNFGIIGLFSFTLDSQASVQSQWPLI